MKIDILTTFPHIFDSYMNESIMKRAQSLGYLDFSAHNLRNWTHDAHKTTDDYVYGGSHGLILKCEPIFEALESLLGCELIDKKISNSVDNKVAEEDNNSKTKIIIPAPHGKVLNDGLSSSLSECTRLVFVCGHYEGIDDRVFCLADVVVSIGDYVITSGELSSMVIIDSVVRKIPGVLGADEGAKKESFADSLLEEPQYTRPAQFKGLSVPQILLSGDKQKIEEYNREKSIERTWKCRPDLIEKFIKDGDFNNKDIEILDKIKNRNN